MLTGRRAGKGKRRAANVGSAERPRKKKKQCAGPVKIPKRLEVKDLTSETHGESCILQWPTVS